MIRPHGAVLPTGMGIVEILTELSEAVCLLIKLKTVRQLWKGGIHLKTLDEDKKTVCSEYLSQLSDMARTPPAADLHITEYLEKIGDPYCFQCGNIVVRTQFTEGGSSLASSLINYFKGLKSY